MKYASFVPRQVSEGYVKDGVDKLPLLGGEFPLWVITLPTWCQLGVVQETNFSSYLGVML